MIWDETIDPGALLVEAIDAEPREPGAISPGELRGWLAIAQDKEGREHAVISDGWRRIRVDVAGGTLLRGPVVLRCRLEVTQSGLSKLLPLRRLVDFVLHRRFARPLYPADPRIERWLTALQVHDGLVDGASHRDLANALFGPQRVKDDWSGRSDSLRSQIRRLVAEARTLSRGGYRRILRKSGRSAPDKAD